MTLTMEFTVKHGYSHGKIAKMARKAKAIILCHLYIWNALYGSLITGPRNVVSLYAYEEEAKNETMCAWTFAGRLESWR